LYANKLSLNVVMTNHFLGSTLSFCKSKSQPDAQPFFSIGEQEIDVITNTRYLEVQLNSQLRWDKFFDATKTKVNHPLGINKYSTTYLPSDVLKKCTEQFISSMYGTVVWSEAAVVNKIEPCRTSKVGQQGF